jgi:hypothetical protein
MVMPAFKATAAMRKSVELMKADGWSDERISAQLGCSRPTLLKHFARELEFGADKVRQEQLANLRRASKRGNVTAAKALLARSDLTAVSRLPADGPKPEKLGKKETADIDAQTAERGTSWQGILKH